MIEVIRLDDLLIYTDEKDTKQVVHVKIVEIGASHITFKTVSNNIITIPMNRVIKIKQKEAPKNE